MENIQDMENSKIGFYYEKVHKELFDAKLNILENIGDTLGKEPDIDEDAIVDSQKFQQYCARYQSFIQPENKEIFLTLNKSKKDIEKEMEKRQLQMLKEIGITQPSLRVRKIMDATRNIAFSNFADTITRIKLARKNETHKWPAKKTIEMPIPLITYFNERDTTILNVLNENLGPKTHPN